MQKIVVPISDLVGYLDETLSLWPRGHLVEMNGPERSERLIKAAATFAQDYILQAMRHLRRKSDPVMALVRELGYPLLAYSALEADELCNEVDDFYLNMILMFDPIVDEIVKTVGKRDVDFQHIAFSEDLIVEVKQDLVAERYKRMLMQVKRLTPPKMVQEVDDLSPYQEYIDYALGEVFGNIHNSAVHDEVKRMFAESLSRQ